MAVGKAAKVVLVARTSGRIVRLLRRVEESRLQRSEFASGRAALLRHLW